MTDESPKQKAQKAATEARASAPDSPPRAVTPRPATQSDSTAKEEKNG
jgi:hypothetical protein